MLRLGSFSVSQAADCPRASAVRLSGTNTDLASSRSIGRYVNRFHGQQKIVCAPSLFISGDPLKRSPLPNAQLGKVGHLTNPSSFWRSQVYSIQAVRLGDSTPRGLIATSRT